IWMLDCLGDNGVDVPRLRNVLEILLSHSFEPEEEDPSEETRFLFSEARSQDQEKVEMHLWIEGKEVPLGNWQIVHKLLKILCRNPAREYTGKQLKDEYSVTNPSKAAHAIKESMEKTQTGAGGWLLTDPIGWADGHAPRRNSTKRGRGRNKSR